MARAALTLHRLQILDSELSEQRSKLREVDGLLGETREVTAARACFTQAEQDLAGARSRLRDLEMDLQVLTERITTTEARLYGGKVTNPKELAAMQQDLSHMKRSRTALEDDVLVGMTGVEDAGARLVTARSQLDMIEGKWRTEQDRLGREAEKLRARVATLTEDRSKLVALVTPRDLSTYEELLRAKGGRAVALLVGGMCEGCRVTLPTGKVQGVRQSQVLVTCTNCGRILFVE
jgi:predicted  nucleic acid-binding Zn-ribbon protein